MLRFQSGMHFQHLAKSRLSPVLYPAELVHGPLAGGLGCLQVAYASHEIDQMMPYFGHLPVYVLIVCCQRLQPFIESHRPQLYPLR
jgi:hypothetical protein